MRRWRGTIDVPLNVSGIAQVAALKARLGSLDLIYHDHLSRCRDTAEGLSAVITQESEGPRPWRMGELFEGREITQDSLNMARWYINGNPYGCPPGGESFTHWSDWWMGWLTGLNPGFAAVGVVTHNRNIQYLYSLYNNKFIYKLYDVHGPNFCSVHVYRDGHIAPWGRQNVPKGIYLIRHGETEWGT